MVSSMAKPGIVEQAWAVGKFPSRHQPAEDFISNLRFQIAIDPGEAMFSA
jgi:hypothetical protein